MCRPQDSFFNTSSLAKSIKFQIGSKRPKIRRRPEHEPPIIPSEEPSSSPLFTPRASPIRPFPVAKRLVDTSSREWPARSTSTAESTGEWLEMVAVGQGPFNRR